MTSERYPTSTPEEREAAIEAAALTMQRGALAVIPTDTVYGLAADAFDADAVAGLLAAKGRGREMPPPVLVSSATTLDALAVEVPDWARTLVDAFWPGPLTLVCKQQPSLQWDLGDARGTVAIRLPDNALTREIIDRTGPLAVSSANLTGHPAATDADAAEQMLGDLVEVVIDDGPSAGGEASTIVDATATRGRVLRLGALSLEQLNAVLDDDVRLGDDPSPVAPTEVTPGVTTGVADEEGAPRQTAAQQTAARKAEAGRAAAAAKRAAASTPAAVPTGADDEPLDDREGAP